MADKKEKRYVSDNAQLMAEWNWEKNAEHGFDPQNLTCGSTKKVWWKCSNGHEWQAIIGNRSKKHGCPYCSNRKVFQGFNDLQTINPTLAAEWNYEKNNGLRPEDVLSTSGLKVWWKCSKGHEWQATIHHRNYGNGCPVCSSERNTSFPEFAIIFYLRKHGLDALHSYKENGYELDIYIPSKKVAIEYDGYYWHQKREKQDIEKNTKCKKDGIRLYRIREGAASLNDSSIDYVVQKNQKDLSQILGVVLSQIVGTYVNVDIERDTIAIENLREHTEKESSIFFSNPEIAKEWNYDKNNNLKPYDFTASSGKKVWWKCSNGHEWQATIHNRSKGKRCPYCSNRILLTGFNDLNTVNPNLVKEWNYEKNIGLTPMDVMPNSGKKVWWKCSKGHEWHTTIDSRNKGHGCPYCSGRYAVLGESDLATQKPELAKEWHPTRNEELTPWDVLPGSRAKVWWQCEHGHEWQAIIRNRSRGIGCPICAKKKQ